MSMTLTDYQTWTVRTSIYPGADKGLLEAIMYATLGLLGEAGESHQAEMEYFSVQNAHPSDLVNTRDALDPSKALADFQTSRRGAMVKEMGDRLFYFARLCTEVGLSMQDVFDTSKEPDYREHEMFTWGKVAEDVKKHARGDYSVSVLREKLGVSLRGCSARIKGKCKMFQVTMDEVIVANVAKLEDRLKRDKLKGTGDSR